MLATATLRDLTLKEAEDHVDGGGAFVDLRPVAGYLDVHIPGSLSLSYERGPGFASRARDCLPLSLELVLLDGGHGDLVHAAASLRGKGFSVVGRVEDGVKTWAQAHGAPASTETAIGAAAPRGTKLDVGDPGAPRVQDALHIPIERLWDRVAELTSSHSVAISAGYGVRAALAVGMLERSGIDEIVFWTHRS